MAPNKDKIEAYQLEQPEKLQDVLAQDKEDCLSCRLTGSVLSILLQPTQCLADDKIRSCCVYWNGCIHILLKHTAARVEKRQDSPQRIQVRNAISTNRHCRHILDIGEHGLVQISQLISESDITYKEMADGMSTTGSPEFLQVSREIPYQMLLF